MVGKSLAIEAARVVCDAGDFACRLPAQISHHRDPAAVTAHTIMEIVQTPHMRQRVEGEGDIAGPSMGDLDSVQLRESVDHIAVEDWRADRCVDLRETRASA